MCARVIAVPPTLLAKQKVPRAPSVSSSPSACTARLADDGHIEIRHERTFFMPGTRAHKFAVATLEAVFAALRAEGLAFRVVKYKRAGLGGKPGVWHFTTSGSGLSWSVDGQWASIEILGAVAQTA